MGKRNIMLTMDNAVIESIQTKGLNISGLCESHLREINSSFEHTSDPSTCKHKFTTPFTAPRGLVKECMKCGIFVNVTSPVTKWINNG